MFGCECRYVCIIQTQLMKIFNQKGYPSSLISTTGRVYGTTFQCACVCILCLNVLGRLIRREENKYEYGGKQGVMERLGTYSSPLLPWQLVTARTQVKR